MVVCTILCCVLRQQSSAALEHTQASAHQWAGGIQCPIVLAKCTELWRLDHLAATLWSNLISKYDAARVAEQQAQQVLARTQEDGKDPFVQWSKLCEENKAMSSR